MADEVLYSQRDRVALITLNRPEYANAQNSAMTYALDAAFARAVNDDDVAVLVLAGAGKHFCAGHDIGTPERDAEVSFDREAVLWWDHVGKDGADARYAREMEVYLGMCRRWREIPKPSVAMVHGACIAGGWVLGPRFAKEVLFTGGRFGAERAYQVGMVSRVVPRGQPVRGPDGAAAGDGFGVRPAPRGTRAQRRGVGALAGRARRPRHARGSEVAEAASQVQGGGQVASGRVGQAGVPGLGRGGQGRLEVGPLSASRELRVVPEAAGGGDGLGQVARLQVHGGQRPQVDGTTGP